MSAKSIAAALLALALGPARWCVAAGAEPLRAEHVIIISIDGLHQADLEDPALQPCLPNILAIARLGTWYVNASTTVPADSLPGTLAYLTGAGPATTGVYYDDTYSRALLPVGASAGDPPGAEVQLTAAIDKNWAFLSGGGDSGFASIDPTRLPLDPDRQLAPVYPHDYLRVNTVFELAHAAGLRTSMMDKHPAYEIAAGPSGKGVDDLYCPEIDAPTALVNGKLLDGTSAPTNIKVSTTIHNVAQTEAYDDLKLDALLRELSGKTARGNGQAPVPAIVAVNFQAVNVGEKILPGGIDLVDGKERVSPLLIDAMTHTDHSIGRIVAALRHRGLWDSTLLVVTAKHGNGPRVGMLRAVSAQMVPDALKSAGIEIAHILQDRAGLIWLKNPGDAARAAKALADLQHRPGSGIKRILWGGSLAAAGLAGSPDRTPDLIVEMKPGLLLLDMLSKREEHGSFVEDDTHVPIILAGGALTPSATSRAIQAPVSIRQIAVTALEALGLDAGKLRGAAIEKTQPLPLEP